MVANNIVSYIIHLFFCIHISDYLLTSLINKPHLNIRGILCGTNRKPYTIVHFHVRSSTFMHDLRFSFQLWCYIWCQEFCTLKLIVSLPNLVVDYGTSKVLFVPLTYFSLVTVAKVIIIDFPYIYRATFGARNFAPSNLLYHFHFPYESMVH